MLAIRQGSESAEADDACPITRQQLEAWLAHFSWQAPELLGIDAVVEGEPSISDDFLDQLAELLWNCREFSAGEPNPMIAGE